MVSSPAAPSPGDASLDDALIPSGVLGGSPRTHGALRKLVLGHLDFVWRSLRRFGVREADVDDSTQRVFMIAGEKLDKIQSGSERAFLVGIATRVAAHARRSYMRREAAEQSFASSPQHARPNPNPEELTQRLEDRELLDRVLDAMPEDLRAVFVLFELEELSVDQIASFLTIPRGTAASRLRRAREVFREQAEMVGTREPTREGGP
ncbi:MAG TPA: sigma-70 family RNA polymerase sigma factor [Polyangiaceae bacterium]|nr:sigma-70 family RNA polymerase sigma factor [Polyangiaceae bacterium]